MNTILQETKKTFTLATPIIAGQVSQMLLGLADTMMIGRVGTVELAAAAFVNVLFHFPFVVIIALYVAVSVKVSHAYGAERQKEAAESFRTGFWLTVIAGIILSLALIALIPILPWFNQPEEVVAIAPSYLVWVSLSMIPLSPAMCIKSFAEALNRPWTVFWIMLGSVLLNVCLNWMLIFGHLGMPALGLPGAGIATFLARLTTVLVLWCYVNRSMDLAPCRPPRWFARMQGGEVLSMLKITGPISGQLTMEFGAFAVTALLIGFFGSAPLAAHQVTISCSGTAFMIPLGLSMALTIRVGHSLGSNAIAQCKRIIIGAHGASTLLMVMTALTFVFLGETLASLFTADPEVIRIAAKLLLVAAFFQIADGAQIISNGALRGMEDVNTPALMLFVSFWILGLPFGAFLSFKQAVGPIGMWTGLAIGISLAATALTFRTFQRLKLKAASLAAA
ncbi:MATE family efflux transporter [Coraliomargarita parva]|uniref:MATE family efflux transporter n=1 Tax=Coraliomargarita parva TaxID=3014050 RepID=UPI0022B5DDFA|nr:MATE family efflux transporter [Coraliomargarita parva]